MSAIERPAMTAAEARVCADMIRAHIDNARDLIVDLYEREGWKALGYGSWRECVVAEFDRSKTHLYREFDAARIEREIFPHGGKLGQVPERQLRPLTQLPEGHRKEAWDEAKATAPNGKLTGKHVERTVAKKLGKPAPEAAAGTSRVNGELAPDPPDVARARAAGRIAPGVVPDVAEPAPESAPDPESPAPDEPESDEVWLEALPARADLAGAQRAIFEADALIFRRLEPARGTFQHHAARVLKASRRKGEFAFRVSRFLKTDHPRHWLACPAPEHGGCGGTGEVPLIGRCPKCHGRGYWIK